MKARVIFADEDRDDIIGDYLAFCTILKEQVLLYNGDKQKAIQATINICIEQGKLVKYLSEHRREVEDYMFALLNDEELKEAYGDYREMLGEERGRASGKAEGLKAERIDNLKKLMKNMGWSIEQAMDALGIPVGEREKYKAMM